MEYSTIGFEVLVTRHDSLKLQNVRVFGTFGIERKRKRVLFMNKDPDSLQVLSNDGDKVLETELHNLFRKPFVGSSHGDRAPLTACSVFSDREKSTLLPPKYAFIGGNIVTLREVDSVSYETKNRSADEYIESVKTPFQGKKWVRFSDSPYGFDIGAQCALINIDSRDPPLSFTIVSPDLTELEYKGNAIRIFDSDILAFGGSWDTEKNRFTIDADDDPYTLLYFNSTKIEKKLHNFLLKAQFSPIDLFDGNNFFSRILPELREKRRKEFVNVKDYYVPAKSLEMLNLGEVYEWYVIETKLLDTFTYFKSRKQ